MLLPRWKVVLALGLALTAAVALSFGQDKKSDAKSDEPTAPKPTPEQQKRIDQLIKQLASDDFTEREQAHKELAKIGPAAIPALREAAKSPEAEVKRRAADLVSHLEELLKSAKHLAPKKVHLKFKDVSVVDAVADLSKQSGYPIQLRGDKTKLVERKITLDTGEISFWEAFDLLCLKAGVMETVPDANHPEFALHVLDGTPASVPTCYAGALRLCIVADSVRRKDGVVEFMVEISIEPRFRQPKVLGAAKIVTALDDQGRPLAAIDQPKQQPAAMRAPAALKLDDKQKTLKELSGTVMFETILADKVLAIDRVASNVGKSVTNDENATLRLNTYQKKPNGDVTINATLSKVLTPNPGGRIVIGPDFKEFQPELRDANGLPYQKTATPGRSISLSNQVLSISQTITYRPQPGCGEPAELSLTSDKRTALSVPFSFRNLTLP
jgi:hypothetical protein